jgi:DNA-binding transcriptional LysR family regulator
MGIMISSAEVLNDEALADRLDLFVTGAGFAAPGCVSASSRLGRVRGSLVARKGHPLAGSKITSADLKEYPLVGGRTARSLQEYVADLGDLSIVCDDFRALIALTLESDALFVSTPSLVSQEIAAGELVELTITDWSPPSMDFGIFSVAKRTLSPTALRTITILRSTFSEIGLGQSA